MYSESWQVMHDFFIAIQSNIIFESSLKLFYIDWDSLSQDFFQNGVDLISFVSEFSHCNRSYLSN